jgi:hypothetical protein
MDIRVTSTVVEIAVKEMGRALDFYRLFGLDIPEPDGPHVGSNCLGATGWRSTTKKSSRACIPAGHPDAAGPSSVGVQGD